MAVNCVVPPAATCGAGGVTLIEASAMTFTVPLAVAAVQAKDAPVGVDVNAILVAEPLKIFADDGVAVAEGFGFTVIATVIGEPVQLFIVGVTV